MERVKIANDPEFVKFVNDLLAKLSKLYPDAAESYKRHEIMAFVSPIPFRMLCDSAQPFFRNQQTTLEELTSLPILPFDVADTIDTVRKNMALPGRIEKFTSIGVYAVQFRLFSSREYMYSKTAVPSTQFYIDMNDGTAKVKLGEFQGNCAAYFEFYSPIWLSMFVDPAIVPPKGLNGSFKKMISWLNNKTQQYSLEWCVIPYVTPSVLLLSGGFRCQGNFNASCLLGNLVNPNDFKEIFNFTHK